MAAFFKSRSVLPGFRLTFGFTLFYLGIIVLIPLGALLLKAASLSLEDFWRIITAPRVLAAYRVSVFTALIAASVNAVLGLLVAWVLARYRFPGRRIVDSIVDLPFALPTSVAGIALTAIYSSQGVIGRYLYPLGIESAYSQMGIAIALTFVGLPFVVRTVQPVLEELDADMEEAAACLGARRLRTFCYVIFPEIRSALVAGFALAFARAIGEYGSVVFISGNLPMKTEIAPLLIMGKLEQFDYTGATAIAVVLLAFSFAVLFAINLINRRLSFYPTSSGKGV